MRYTYEIPDIECVLHTDRLNLRLIREDDVEPLWPHVTNPAITEFLAWEVHATPDVTRAVNRSLVEAKQKDAGITWLCFKNDDMCGLVSLIDIKRHHRTWVLNRAELSYWLAPSHQGRGLMTEACNAVIKFAFHTLEFHKLVAAHAHDNPASGNVLKRLGFVHVGHERDAFCKNSVWHNLIKYDLLSGEQKHTIKPDEANS